MKKEDIKKSFDNIEPDEKSTNKMLNNIMNFYDSKEKVSFMKKISSILTNKPFIICSTGVLSILIIVLVYSLVNINQPKKYVPNKNDTIFTKAKFYSYSEDSAGTDTKSSINISLDKNSSKKYIESSIKFEPETNFKVEELSEKEYKISFEKELASNQLYKVSIPNADKKLTWAFQTKNTFKVISTLPAHMITSVPLNSGIEITFSSDNYENIDNYFEIEPKTEGKFEYHKKVAVFVPKALKPETLYTVKIKKGLSLKNSTQKLESDFSFQFETDSSIKKSIPKYLNYFSSFRDFQNVTPDKEPIIYYNADENAENKEVTTTIYQYKDTKTFIEDFKKGQSFPRWCSFQGSSYKFDTKSLTKQSSFKSKLLYIKDQNSKLSVIFPSKLPEGYYLISSTYDNKTVYLHLQVSSLEVSTTVMNNQSLTWVIDVSSKKPIEGANINIENIGDGKTDKDGVSLIPTKDKFDLTSSIVIVKSKGKSDFVAPLDLDRDFGRLDQEAVVYSNKYWSYLYPDRLMYLPNDTLNVWGIIKERTGSIPKNATLTISSPTDSLKIIDNLSSIEVKTDDFGTFNGNIKLPNLDTGNYQINLIVNNKVIKSTYFEVKNYVKPLYIIDLKVDKSSIFKWETVTQNISATYFEGTPVSNLELKHSINEKSKNIKLDKDGKTSVSINSNDLTSSNGEMYKFSSINVENIQPEESQASERSHINVFTEDVMIESESINSKDKSQLKINVNNIDLSKIRNSIIIKNDDFRGKPIDKELNVEIIENYYNKTEIGEYYDFINKKNVKKYDYTLIKNSISTNKVSTSNGKCTIDIPKEKGKYYTINITTQDSKGNRVFHTRNVISDFNEPNYYNNDYFIVSDKSADTPYYTGNYLKENESVNILLKNASDSPLKNGKLLLYTLKDGYLSHLITTNSSSKFTFTDQHIPNVFVVGIYFDNEHMYSAGIIHFIYNKEDKKLNVEIKSDKTNYKPGENVTIKVKTSDVNKKPCTSNVNLSVVDEAFFALKDNIPMFADTLYSNNFIPGIIMRFLSYTPPNNQSIAEGGGEGGNGTIRSDFKDTCFFKSIITDSNGEASTSFKLPDNLTSWRITSTAITKDNKAGDSKININSKLPFFINLNANSSFLEGDKPEIAVSAFGTDLNNNSEVKFDIAITDLNNNKIQSFNPVTIGNKIALNVLNELKEGKYTITASATSGDNKDSLKRDFTVYKTYFETNTQSTQKLTENISFETNDRMASLLFFNTSLTNIYNTLMSIDYCGNRVDQIIAAKYLNSMFGKLADKDISETEIFTSSYQLQDGGISLLGYDSSDVELSTKLVLLDKNQFDKTKLIQYFNNIILDQKSTPLMVCAAYCGLIALDEPVLIDIYNTLGTENLGLNEKLYLLIGLAYSGDDSKLQEYYSEITKKHLKTENNIAFVENGKDRDDYLITTSLFSVLANKINALEKDKLFNYIVTNSTNDILLNLEKLIYIKETLNTPKSNCNFIYTLDNEDRKVNIEGLKNTTITLTPAQLKNIKFKNISGDISVITSFRTSSKNSIDTTTNTLSISRSYSYNDKQTSNFGLGEFVKVSIKPKFSATAPDGLYEITDIIPSGMGLCPPNYDTSLKTSFPTSVDGKRVAFIIQYNKKTYKESDFQIEYFIRPVNSGTFKCDSCIIKSLNSKTSAEVKTPTEITIKR